MQVEAVMHVPAYHKRAGERRSHGCAGKLAQASAQGVGVRRLEKNGWSPPLSLSAQAFGFNLQVQAEALVGIQHVHQLARLLAQ